MNIGNKIINLRNEKKMSQSQLAELLDVSRQTISKWECNICDPEVGRIKQMATIFNVTTDYLLDNTIDNNITKKSVEKAKRKITISKNVKITILLGLISLASFVYLLIYCYLIDPYTYYSDIGWWKKGIAAHILGHQEIGNDGIVILIITIIFILFFIIQLLLTIIKQRGKKTC